MNRRRFLHILGSGAAALSLGPVLGPAWAVSAFDLGIQGQDRIAARDYAGAVRVLEQAVGLEPGNDWCWGLLGRAYDGQGKPGKAVAAFRAAVRVNPQDTYSRMMIQRITQRPIPRTAQTDKPLTPMEKEAMAEERRMMARLRDRGTGLGYQVRRVVIDPGHGGFDPGAVGQSGLKEKDVVLDIGKRLRDRLAREGKVTPFLTRTGDYYIPLSDRTVIANQYRADLFISLHINANNNRKARGSETYFCSAKASSKEAARVASFENAVIKHDPEKKKIPGQIDIEEILFKFEQKNYWEESGKFAKTFQERFRKELPFKSRGVNSANFYVLRRAKMPAILLETGFISNPENEAQLKRSSVIDGIVDAVVRGLA